MHFYNEILQFIDMRDYYRSHIKKLSEKRIIDLKYVVKQVIDKELCEGEQSSNWAKRPLT